MTSGSPEIFISYASPDIDRAHQLRIALEAAGQSCWMAPDDIRGTTGWPEQIAAAIAGCHVMLVLVSAASLTSRHVPKEADLAFSKGKALIPVRLEAVPLTGPLEYLLSLSQWVDLYPGPVDAHVDELMSTVGRAVAETPKPPAERAVEPSAPAAPRRAPPLVRPRSGARRVIRTVIALAGLIALAVSIISFLSVDRAGGQSQEFSVDPAQARVGTQVRAVGRNWAAGNPVEIQWDAAYGTVLATGMSDASGSFSIAFVVPAGAAPGSHPVWACQYPVGAGCSPSDDVQVMRSTTLTVLGDSAPVANPDEVVTSIGIPLVIPDRDLIANDADPDGDPLCATVQVSEEPTLGTLTRSSSEALTYTPRPDAYGTDSFTYEVCETAGGVWSNPALVTIRIVFSGTVAVQPTSGEPGTRTTLSGRGFPAAAAVSISWDGTRTSDTRADGQGAFSASLVVPDGEAGSSTITACALDRSICATTTFERLAPSTPPPPPPEDTVSPEPTNDSTVPSTASPPPLRPVAADDHATCAVDDSVVIAVTANDTDPDGQLVESSLRIVTPPGTGRATVTGPGLVTYTAAGASSGSTDRFRYEICDETSLCSSAWVSVAVSDVATCELSPDDVGPLTLDPAEGRPGSRVRATLGIDPGRLDGCIAPMIQFLWAGTPWGAATAITDGVAIADLDVPMDAQPGTHDVTAVAGSPGSPELASAGYTVSAPVPIAADPVESDGSLGLWWILPVVALAVTGGGLLAVVKSPARRRARLGRAVTLTETKAAELLAQAHALDADLDLCEAESQGGVLVVPGDAPVGETGGGRSPYLLEFDNPYAPPQIDDDHRGWYHPRRKEPIRGVVIHTTEGLGLAGATADRVARFFATSPRPLSAHAVIDARGAITLLPDDYTALHAARANSASLGLVICLPPDPEGCRKALAHAARWCRVKSREHEFPLQRIGADEWGDGAGGILGHSDLDPASPDPMSPSAEPFPWAEVVREGGGPSHLPGAAPVRRSERADPCAGIRSRSELAHREANAAARRASRALADLIGASGPPAPG